MTKQKLLYFLVGLLLLPSLALADATTTPVADVSASSTATSALATSTQGSVLGLQAPPVPKLIAQVKQAKIDLAGIKLNYALNPVYKNIKNKKTGKITKNLSGYSLTAKDIALAILDPATGQIGITLGMQTGKTMSFKDPNFSVSLSHFNGVNSSFEVSKPQNGVVLALKYLITGPEQGSKAAIVNALSEAVYVPYSDNLNSVDVIAYGETYIDNLIKRSAAEFKNFPSSAVPGKTIPQAIKPAMIRALVYAEHTDTATVLQGGNIQDTINRLNILFATNESDAYKYSVSTAGARGIAQFMPSTYTGLVQRHPEANLISDPTAGLSDHYNSIKAMYLLLDDYAGAVRAKAQTGFSEGLVFDYGAASYNGGVTRVVKAVNTFGSSWNLDQSGQINGLAAQVSALKAQIKKTKDKKTKAGLQAQLNDTSNQLTGMQSAALRNETVNYLQKIYKVIPLFGNSEEI
jgi:hypothetical protein